MTRIKTTMTVTVVYEQEDWEGEKADVDEMMDGAWEALEAVMHNASSNGMFSEGTDMETITWLSDIKSEQVADDYEIWVPADKPTLDKAYEAAESLRETLRATSTDE